MPNAHVPAAVTGLPKSSPLQPVTPDLHLSLAREIERIATLHDRLDAECATLGEDQPRRESEIETTLAHLADSECALVEALAALPCTSLKGAAIQVAAACRQFDLVRSAVPDPADCRTLQRLLASAAAFLTHVAGLDADRDGIGQLFLANLDPWRAQPAADAQRGPNQA